MRTVLAVVATLVLSGCATTVYRAEGSALTPAGVAKTPCEVEDWLVVAKTRAEVPVKHKKTSERKEGLGLYKVGDNSPESIPDIEGLDSPGIQDKRNALVPYHRKQIIAGSLGAAALIALAVGTVVFVNAFESKSIRNADGSPGEDNTINGGRAALGGTLVGIGFGLGIGGLVVNPSNTDRTRADATRYVFFDPPDSQQSVTTVVKEYDEGVRARCLAPSSSTP